MICVLCMAVIAGVRPGICMMAVPSPILVVFAAMNDSGTIASLPYASAVHVEVKPRRSASRIRS